MRVFKIIFTAFILAWVAACADDAKPSAPLDTLKIYTQAIKRKDTAMMKRMLSKGSLKMAQDEAAQQNESLDEALQKETLFSSEQTSLEFRNEKIEGDSATIEVKNSFGTWDVVPFVREDGRWKIAKERYADELMKRSEEDSRKMDEQFNRERQP